MVPRRSPLKRGIAASSLLAYLSLSASVSAFFGQDSESEIGRQLSLAAEIARAKTWITAQSDQVGHVQAANITIASSSGVQVTAANVPLTTSPAKSAHTTVTTRPVKHVTAAHTRVTNSSGARVSAANVPVTSSLHTTAKPELDVASHHFVTTTSTTVVVTKVVAPPAATTPETRVERIAKTTAKATAAETGKATAENVNPVVSIASLPPSSEPPTVELPTVTYKPPAPTTMKTSPRIVSVTATAVVTPIATTPGNAPIATATAPALTPVTTPATANPTGSNGGGNGEVRAQAVDPTGTDGGAATTERYAEKHPYMIYKNGTYLPAAQYFAANSSYNASNAATPGRGDSRLNVVPALAGVGFAIFAFGLL